MTRRPAEERDSEADFSALFELTAVGAAQANPATGRFIRVNQRFCEMTGFSADELLERTFLDITHPEDREREIVRTRPVLSGEADRWTSEKRYLRKDGSVAWVLVSGSLIRDPSGRPLRTIAIIQDISEQKRTEAALRRANDRLHQVLGSITEAYFALDGEFRFLEVNRAAEEVIFRKPAAELIGRGFWEVFPQGVGSEFWKQYRAAMADGQERHFEGRSQIVDKWFETHVYPRDGRLEVYFRDVTERKRAEEALRESVERLRDADRRKDEFLAMLGHELRNPIAPILMAVELLRRKLPSSPDVERLRDVIERQARHLARLVDDLLEVSRITLGKIRLERQRVDVRAVIARALETSRPVIDARRHELRVELPGEPVEVDADPVRLAQVVANLLHNAAKYTEIGGRIQVRVAREGDQAVIRVADTGVGIPADMLDRVFDLFAQSDRSLDRAEGGLGIGLTLARRIVEMHDGEISAESAGPGRGSTFTVRLAALRPEAGAPRQAGPEEGAAPARRLRVLVVDDNLDAAELLADLVESLGHEVHVAHDGLAALEAAERCRPEVVLLDIGLPRMDGLEVARRLRGAGQDLTLVAVTGYGQEEDRRRSLAAGFNAHLVKPIDLAALTAALASSLEATRPRARP